MDSRVQVLNLQIIELKLKGIKGSCLVSFSMTSRSVNECWLEVCRCNLCCCLEPDSAMLCRQIRTVEFRLSWLICKHWCLQPVWLEDLQNPYTHVMIQYNDTVLVMYVWCLTSSNCLVRNKIPILSGRTEMVKSYWYPLTADLMSENWKSGTSSARASCRDTCHTKSHCLLSAYFRR